jgi:hypothetical protein
MYFKSEIEESYVRLGCCPKLVERYCRYFEILEKIGSIACILILHASMRVHNVFHVSLLNKYVYDPNHIIDCTVIQV